MENILCCNCGTANEAENIYCETCGIDLEQFIELKKPTTKVPVIPIDMIKTSKEQPLVKYDREIF